MTREIRLIAFDRPHYLEEVVEAVKRMRGADRCRIVASVDRLPSGTHNQEVVALCREVTDDVRLRERLDCNAHIRLNFREMHDEGSGEVLYLEDDIVPSSDCLEWCGEHAPILRTHSRVKTMCLLGNNHGDVHVAYRNWHAFRCTRWYSAWGNYWTRDGLGQAISVWPQWWDNSDNVTWDSRLNGQFIDHDWLSLIPFLSRVKNIGAVGRYCKTDAEYRGRVRDFWADSDFSKPIAANWH